MSGVRAGANESSSGSETSDVDAESSGSSGSTGPAGPAPKRARRSTDGVVIVSSLGDLRPDEIVVDTLANCCVNFCMSVRNYAVMSDFGSRPMFLANKAYKALGKAPAFRYVKQMLPRTSYLKDIDCDVMIIHAHGGVRRVNVEKNTKRPYYLTFHEPDHVDAVSGERKITSSMSAVIYSCSLYNDGVNEYTAPDGAATLSGVVGDSGLVLLLSCCGRSIIEEYSSEMRDRNNPDFVVFLMDDHVHDVSIYIFITLLIAALESRTINPSPWDEFFKRSVCHVLYWIKRHGVSGDTFWNFLKKERYISPHGRGSYRIKGFINNFKLHAGDEDRLLLELQSLTLLQWRRPAGDTLGKYDWEVAQARTEHELAALICGGPFLKASAPAALPGSAPRLDAMLLQLKGLMRGA